MSTEKITLHLGQRYTSKLVFKYVWGKTNAMVTLLGRLELPQLGRTKWVKKQILKAEETYDDRSAGLLPPVAHLTMASQIYLSLDYF